MKIKEALVVSAIPILMIILLQGASVVSFMNCCSWPLMMVLYMVIGYFCQRKNIGLEEAAICGAIAGIASAIVFAISILIYDALFGDISSFVFSNASEIAQNMSGGAIGGLVVIFLIPVFGIGGAIMSFVGYSFLGRALKSVKIRY